MLFISILLLSMNVALGFSIENSLGEQTQFFSSNLDEVIVKSDSNTTVELYYKLSNSSNSTTLNLQECDTQYCANFFLTNYTLYNNSVQIEQLNASKTVYLDDQKPQIINLNYLVDEENKTLTLNYSFQDNSNKTVKAELFKKEGNDFVFEKNLTTTTQTTYDVTSSQNTNFLIKLEDSVGNTYEESFFVEVDDIFKPKIVSYKIISKQDGTFDLYFSIKDESLEEYKISQDSLFLSEKISGSEFQTRVTLPFSRDSILLNITDTQGNFQEQIISLQSKISISSFPKYSNDEEIEFTSNAQSCRLDEFNGRDSSSNFQKSGNDFSQELNLRENQENTLVIYCEKDNYAQYFSKEVIYDTQNPEDVELEVEMQDDGSLYLTWSSSEDNFDDVEYEIYRNGNKIDTTSKTSFKDTLVQYPNEYEYEIVPVDLAKNKAESNIVEQTPKKVSVTLSFNNKEQETTSLNTTKVSFETEEGVTLLQEVKQNGVTKFSKEINATSSSMTLEFPLFLGANELRIVAKDDLGNTNTQSKYVIYEQEQIVEEEITPPTTVNTPQEEPTISASINTTNTTSPQPSTTSSLSSWVWFFIFLIFLGIFLFVFVFDEEKLRKLSIRNPRRRALHARKLKDDEILGKSLEITKQKRIQKQQELAEKKRKEAEKKKIQEQRTTSYQQKKHEELSKKSKTDFSIFPKKSSSKKVIQPKEKSPSLHSQKTQEEPQKTSFKEKLLSRKKIQPQEEKDPLSTYLQSKKSTGYQDTKSYRASYHEEQQRKKQEEEAKKQQEKQEQEYAKQLESKKQQEEAQKKEKTEFTSKNNEKKSSKDKLSLDDYLNKRTKKKRFYFAEKEVERNLKSRK